MRRLLIMLAAGLMAGGGTAPLSAQSGLTQEQALALAFPDARVQRRTAYLDRAQLERASSLAGEAVTQSVVTHYVARRAGRHAGVAYFDSHRVRTHGEVLMIVVAADGTVQRVEVLRFAEPPEYIAPDGWLDLFQGRRLDPELAVKRGVPNISGATLTARAVTAAVRRVLALHTVIRPFAAS